MNIRDLTPWAWGGTPARRGADRPAPVSNLRDSVDRLFEDFFQGFDLVPLSRTTAWGELAPRIDVARSDKDYRFSMELPGVNEDDVDVSVEDGVLTIRGEKHREHKEESEGNLLRMERSFGSFQRSFSLPDDIKEDGIQASFDKGVLTVTVPREAKQQPAGRKIPIGKHAEKAA